MPAVDYVVLTAGSFDILAEVVCENDDDLIELLNTEIRTIPGVAVHRDVRLPQTPQAVLQLGNPLGTGSPRRRDHDRHRPAGPGERTARRRGRRCSRRRSDHLWMHFSRQSVHGGARRADHRQAARATTSGTRRASSTSTASPGLFVVNAGHGRRRLAEVAAKQAERARVLPDLVVRAPDRHRARRPARVVRPGRPEPRLLLHRRRRGRRDRVQARQVLLEAAGHARPSTRSSRARSPTTAPRRARSRSPASRP